MQTDSKSNDLLKGYLETLCRCYSTGRFETLFPLLADGCVLESQWVLTPNTGKAAVVDYLERKGATLRKSNSCPTCTIVEFVGNMNLIRNAQIHPNGEKARRASVGLWYPEGKLAMLMSQALDGGTNEVIVDLQLDENRLISRIDLCMPGLFRFRHVAGPFESEEKPDDAAMEVEIRRMLEEAGDDFSELDEYIDSYEDSYSGDLADFAFRAAIQAGNSEYVDIHAEDFDLNDGDGYSTYLDETEDEDIQYILMSHGAFRSWENYDDCQFAMNTLNGWILTFDPDFQKEVFRRYKEAYELSDERIAGILSGDGVKEVSGRNVKEDLSLMGVSLKDGEIIFADMEGKDGYDLKALLKDLGWDCCFEGDSWQFETTGVYYIPRGKERD